MKPNEIDLVNQEIYEIQQKLYELFNSQQYNSHKYSDVINECKLRLEQLNVQIVIVDALENRK